MDLIQNDKKEGETLAKFIWLNVSFLNDDLNLLKDKKAIFRKFILYVDISFKDGEFILGQKLNSFFGQAGIFENTEIIENYIKNFYENSLNSAVFIEDHKEFDEYEDDDDIEDDQDDFVIHLPLTMLFYFDSKSVDFYTYSS